MGASVLRNKIKKNDHAQHLSVENFMASPKYDERLELMRQQQA